MEEKAIKVLQIVARGMKNTNVVWALKNSKAPLTMLETIRKAKNTLPLLRFTDDRFL